MLHLKLTTQKRNEKTLGFEKAAELTLRFNSAEDVQGFLKRYHFKAEDGQQVKRVTTRHGVYMQTAELV